MITHEVERSVSVLISGFSGVMVVLFLLVIRSPKKLRIAEQNSGAGAMTNAAPSEPQSIFHLL